MDKDRRNLFSMAVIASGLIGVGAGSFAARVSELTTPWKAGAVNALVGIVVAFLCLGAFNAWQKNNPPK